MSREFEELIESLLHIADLERIDADPIEEPVQTVTAYEEMALSEFGGEVKVWIVAINGRRAFVVGSEVIALSIARNFGGMPI